MQLDKSKDDEIAVNSRVVFKSGLETKVWVVASINGSKAHIAYLLLPVRIEACVSIENIRHATPAEIAARHRIDSQSDINATHSSKSIATAGVAASEKFESDTLDFVDSRHISPDCHVFSDLPELQVPPKPKPVKPLYTPLELELMHKIEHLQCSRMAWRIACAGLVAVAFCVWVGWLS